MDFLLSLWSDWSVKILVGILVAAFLGWLLQWSEKSPRRRFFRISLITALQVVILFFILVYPGWLLYRWLIQYTWGIWLARILGISIVLGGYMVLRDITAREGRRRLPFRLFESILASVIALALVVGGIIVIHACILAARHSSSHAVISTYAILITLLFSGVYAFFCILWALYAWRGQVSQQNSQKLA